MISFFDFSSQLLFSLFEVAAAAVILLFGWYFARVIGWYASKYFGASKFYSLFKRIWTNIRWAGRMDLPKLVGEIVKWWLLLAFVAVSAAIIGFGAVSQFLGKALEDFARAGVAIFVFSLAALVSDHFPGIIGSRFLRRLRNPSFLRRAAVFTTWALALLVAAFIAKLVPLKKVIDWGGVILVLVLVVALAAELGVKERTKKLAAMISKRFKKAS